VEVRQILSVLLVFTLLAVVLWMLRRKGIPKLRELIPDCCDPGTASDEPAPSRRRGYASGVAASLLSSAIGRGGAAASEQQSLPPRGVYPLRAMARFLSRPASRTKSLRAVERLTLTPHHSLHLVELRGREFLVATYPQGCTLLPESGPARSSRVEAAPSQSPAEPPPRNRAEAALEEPGESSLCDGDRRSSPAAGCVDPVYEKLARA
jgi:hypothetical protein